MFRKLFGYSESSQLAYLGPRVILTAAALILIPLSSAFGDSSVGTNVFSLIMLFVWGWPAVKALFGITAVASIFSGNVAVGAVLFVVYIMVSFLIGSFIALLGTGRWLYLLVKRSTGRVLDGSI